MESMYIRSTQTRSVATGEKYFTHRLVRSERFGTKVRQVTLLNLGSHFPVDCSLWSSVCKRIEEIVNGQTTFVEMDLPADAAKAAENAAAQLLTQMSDVAAKKSATAAREEPARDLQTVDINTLEHVRPRSVGVEHVGLWAMQQTGFEDHLTELGISGPQRAAIMGSIIGRMAEPGSEAATGRWLSQQSALGEFLQADFETMNPMALYRASDRLMRHREAIERRVFDRAHDLFGLTTTVTLYDLTNTYFEGTASGNKKARRGHSKEKRTDCPLVTLGLILDGSGFVRRSETFEGSVAEGSTLENMLGTLDAPIGALVVMDAGIATEANLTWLRTEGYRYLVVSRERGRQFVPDDMISIETAGGAKVSIQRVDDTEGNEVRLYCHSEGRQQKEEGIIEGFCQRFEAGLQKIADGIAKTKQGKRLDKVHEQIGRLKEKSHGVGQHYVIHMIADEQKERVISLHWEKRPKNGTMLTHPGVYCLRSNQTDWETERLWRTYTLLTDLESVFRSLKSELGLRPVYHQAEGRVDGHLFITVLAYQFVQIIRRSLKAKKIPGRWSTLREILSVQRRLTTSFIREDGRTLHVRKTSQPEPDLLAIYNALGLDPLPGGVQKTCV